ncbi:recombinase family protein [Ilumatobacter sp.]|uniref:recombinase family protein n=1 Tax=Ilumatobacter sp. TaxID=1967498 RepID=UPI003B51D24F
MPTRRAVIYARLSVSSDESVSIERQVEACAKYAESRRWDVVGTFVDDGVSASKNKPEDRPGWSELLAAPQKYDAVIIWKVDRLARRTLDFLHADEALRARNTGIVAVEDPVDMTTAQGRAFATMLAVFAELEADSISARVQDAQMKLLRSGRTVGGTVPYGWRSVENPNGPGMVLAQDPDHIGYVRGAVERIQRGNSIYSVMQWLNEVGAPTAGVVRAHRRSTPEPSPGTWSYNTVEGIVRHPILAGLTPFNRNGGLRTHEPYKKRGDDVLRGADGLPVVDESLAIMSVADWRAMVAGLDAKDTGRSKPRALRTKTSPLLSGLMWCGEHGTDGVRMHRCASGPKRHGYTCPQCGQTITSFENVVVAEFLRRKGGRVRWTPVHRVVEGGAALLPEIEHRLDELDQLIRLATNREQRTELQEQQNSLLDLRDAKRAEPSTVSVHVEDAGWFQDDWDAAVGDVEAQRRVLDDAVERIWVRRGGTGRRTEAQILARLTFDWKIPEDMD